MCATKNPPLVDGELDAAIELLKRQPIEVVDSVNCTDWVRFNTHTRSDRRPPSELVWALLPTARLYTMDPNNADHVSILRKLKAKQAAQG